MSLDVGHWLVGRLSNGERVLTALAPALLLAVYLGLAALVYWVRGVQRGPFRDEEMAQRAAGGLASQGVRQFFAWTMRPCWTLLARVRFPPNAITSLSFAFALGAGLGVAAGRFALGGWLFVVAGALDFLDGRVARSTGRSTLGGAALDSVLDRYVESALIVGLAWYYRHDWVLVACLLALTGSLLVPYVRARGESLGVSLADVGFMQRPERVLLLGAGTALSPILEVVLSPADPHPPHRLAIGALLLLGVMSHATALHRLHRLVRALGGGRRPNVGQPLRGVLAQALATLADFAVASALVYLLSAPDHAPAATAAGCVVGALVSFILARVWAFGGRGAWLPQVPKYMFVSAATALLNAGGVALLLALNAPFVLAWCLTRVVVFATWSYPLQRDFVFVPALDPAPERKVPSAPGHVVATAGRGAR
jgi:phosphatidylglycerophosphate synthase/putative flippase GtrA